MKTIRRLIYGEVFAAVFFVLLAFLSLFVFFDLVDELPDVGKRSALAVPSASRQVLNEPPPQSVNSARRAASSAASSSPLPHSLSQPLPAPGWCSPSPGDGANAS